MSFLCWLIGHRTGYALADRYEGIVLVLFCPRCGMETRARTSDGKKSAVIPLRSLRAEEDKDPSLHHPEDRGDRYRISWGNSEE